MTSELLTVARELASTIAKPCSCGRDCDRERTDAARMILNLLRENQQPSGTVSPQERVQTDAKAHP